MPLLRWNKVVVICVKFLVKTKSSLFGNFHRVGAFVAKEQKTNLGIFQNNKWEDISDWNILGVKFMCHQSQFLQQKNENVISGGRVLCLWQSAPCGWGEITLLCKTDQYCEQVIARNLHQTPRIANSSSVVVWEKRLKRMRNRQIATKW